VKAIVPETGGRAAAPGPVVAACSSTIAPLALTPPFEVMTTASLTAT